jgi:membrane-associated phospholipid phosphatase
MASGGEDVRRAHGAYRPHCIAAVSRAEALDASSASVSRTCPGVIAHVPPLDEFSFPSGHTLQAVSFTIVAMAWYPHSHRCC